MTRISSEFFFNRATAQMARQQFDMAQTQAQISEGKRLLKPSDDPSASARTLDIRQTIASLDQYEENAIFARQRLGLEDATLENVSNILQRVRELALASNTGAPNAETRSAYRTEVEQQLGALLNLANTRDTTGDYLFSGNKGRTQAFTRAGGSFIYNGDQGQQRLQVGGSRQIEAGDSGDRVFMRMRNGNGDFVTDVGPANTGDAIISVGSVTDQSAFSADDFTIRFTSATTYDIVNDTTATTLATAQPYASGEAINFNGAEVYIEGTPTTGDTFTLVPARPQSVFDTLQGFVSALELNPSTPNQQAELNQKVNQVITDVDQALGHVLDVRTSVGARLNAVDSTGEENQLASLQFKTTLSQLEDLDYTEAVSRLKLQLTTLEAVQKVFSSLQNLSLFNILRF